jgi:hypothetical protein
MSLRSILLPLAASALVGACAQIPSGPSIPSLPGSTKSPAQFQADAAACRQYADAALGGVTAGQAYNDTVAANAIAGTALGAAAGAIIGSATGQAGAGAAIGAGTGLLFGSAAGSNVAGLSAADVQRRYDSVYLQCMYAKGNRVPARVVAGAPSPSVRALPAPSYPPPNTLAPSRSGGSAPAPSYPPADTLPPYYPSAGPRAPAYPPPGTPAPTYPPPGTPAPTFPPASAPPPIGQQPGPG